MTQHVAASVHQRLRNLARAKQRPFNELLQYYALERFLYRLGRSPYREQLVLKGALMFTVWEAPFPRPTRDIDLLGRLDNALEHIVTVIREICEQPVIDDGLHFAAETISAKRILQAAAYEGVRVRFTAYLGSARIPMQIDVGFGDPVVPGIVPIRIPPLLEFPAPEIQGYSRESTIAEKLESMVRLGELNSRMKDFFDIWLLANRYPFDSQELGQAIRETFRQRRTPLVTHPVALGESFAEDLDKQAQWAAFLRRYHLSQEAAIPRTLSTATTHIAAFLQPVLEDLVAGEACTQHWQPGGPWLRDKQ
ncbi:MAG: nucleotidyl transferase AbiEii/AbiGii toxin family protein [Anaerolineae bacterium]|nr:nucleotidyl transferase AbiEii/AbiGii toxin family protein [Anaerolineae bacterium]